jgi:hypothetical protein
MEQALERLRDEIAANRTFHGLPEQPRYAAELFALIDEALAALAPFVPVPLGMPSPMSIVDLIRHVQQGAPPLALYTKAETPPGIYTRELTAEQVRALEETSGLVRVEIDPTHEKK